MILETENKPDTTLTRAELLKMVEDSIIFCKSKATANRITVNDSDKTRLSYMRCLADLVSVYLSGLKDLDLDDLNERMTALEEERKNAGAHKHDI